MFKYKLIIEYDGTGYRGWQAQQNARSIQGTILQVAEKTLGPVSDFQGSGRTDAGVHALGQAAHLVTERPWEAKSLRERLNDALPSNINVLSAEKVSPGFTPATTPWPGVTSTSFRGAAPLSGSDSSGGSGTPWIRLPWRRL